MNGRQLLVRRLADEVLRGRSLPLELLLEVLIPVRRLRALARQFGVSPKGGFRLDRAPARVLAPLLARLEDPAQLDEVLAELLQGRDADGAASGGAKAAPEPAEPQPIVQLREQELQRARDELERARQAAARALEREAALRRELEQRDEEVQRLRAELQRPRPSAPAPGGSGRDDSALLARLRDLEHEIEAREAADAALRRQLAVERSRLRAAEEENAELSRLVPPGRRRRKQEPPPPPERRVVLPYFAPSFYRSLDGKDRRSVERAMLAILLFCTEGHSYPGLEVKQLGGQDTWSLRASLGLRVYFRPRADGDVEFLELADREDQHTTLRRLKDR